MPIKPTKMTSRPSIVTAAHAVTKNNRRAQATSPGSRNRTSMTRQQRQERKHAEEKVLAKQRAQAVCVRVQQEKEAEDRAKLKQALELKRQSTERAGAAFLADPSMSKVLSKIALGDAGSATNEVSENALSQLELQQLRGIFAAEDDDEDGLISDDELREALVALGYSPTDAVVETFRPRVRARSSTTAASSAPGKQALSNNSTASPASSITGSSAIENSADTAAKQTQDSSTSVSSATRHGSKHNLLASSSRQGSRLNLRAARARSSTLGITSQSTTPTAKGKHNKRIPFAIDLSGFLGAARALDNSVDCIDDILPAFEFLSGSDDGKVSREDLIRLLNGVHNSTSLSESEVGDFLAAAAKLMPTTGTTSQRVDTVNLLENLMFV